MVSRVCSKCSQVWYSANAESDWKCDCGETIPVSLNGKAETVGDILQKKITRNMVKCLKCGDVIESRHRHDFKTCSCDNVSVDGGTDYLKRCFVDYDKFQDLSTYEGDSINE